MEQYNIIEFDPLVIASSLVYFSTSCSIQFDDYVVVTGGISGNCEGGSTSCGVTTVAAYDENGWTEDLPTLNQGRFHHGCNSYIGQNNELV